jgi:predicted permease
LPRSAYAAPGDAARYIIRATDAIAALPGVRAVGAVTKLPLAPEARRDTALFVEDRPLAAGTMPNIHQVVFASPGYFSALGIPLVDGRVFERPDPERAPREVILSRSVAERYWRDERAVGKRVRMSPVGAWYTVVGVAGDVRGTALDQPPDEIIYVPPVVALGATNAAGATETRWTPFEIAFVARGDRDVASIAARVGAAVRAIDPSVPTYAGRAMTEIVSQASARTSFTLVLLGIASTVALALGAIGIYGVISYAVSLRTREIAIRLALGARPQDVRRMVSRQAAVVAVVGVAIGLVSALALMRVLRALLFGVSPADPVALAGAAALLTAVSAAATWLPARRAASLNPAQALRAE